MTLTELRYVVALAREKHFGHAAQAAFVSQPTLSVAIKKLEEELGATLFERSMQEVYPTAIGEQVVAQAQLILNQVEALKELVKKGQDPKQGALQVGMIYSVAPYLLPQLMPHMMAHHSQMPLIVQENYTHILLERVKQGTLDAAFVALPVDDSGLCIAPLYDEAFFVALSKKHPLAKRKHISGEALTEEALLVLGVGHCFREQVLQATPRAKSFRVEQDGLQKAFEGTSLETLRHMAASGLGVTVLPALAVVKAAPNDPLVYVPFAKPVPTRRVVLVWRKNYSRSEACETLAQAVRECGLMGVSVKHKI
ncbi:hydrogen peroxide-inducible genes activator [Hydromonas duriensis]|uniref:LysR family transcriptional regulator n=1 Tax=Hydromonas duriensis TaxID=1527608 RepID=A0A4R6YBM2_9BURK|nr:hydrogen peroxide-inducible genes activator [Hydromonas duriensis]TDR32958.1 LysR family transcriptional regulator [Hydromonas duriensis]